MQKGTAKVNNTVINAYTSVQKVLNAKYIYESVCLT